LVINILRYTLYLRHTKKTEPKIHSDKHKLPEKEAQFTHLRSKEQQNTK